MSWPLWQRLGLFGNVLASLATRAPSRHPSGVRWTQERCSMGGPGDQRVCDSQPPNAALQEDPATGRVQGLWGRLRAPLTVPEWGAVCAFGKDHVTRASNFDTGEQDAAGAGRRSHRHDLADSAEGHLMLPTGSKFGGEPDDAHGHLGVRSHWSRVTSRLRADPRMALTRPAPGSEGQAACGSSSW
jgi:hypothetical protein